MKAPQIIMIFLATIDIVEALIKHGQKKTGEYNFGATLLTYVFVFALLHWGGFWK